MRTMAHFQYVTKLTHERERKSERERETEREVMPLSLKTPTAYAMHFSSHHSQIASISIKQLLHFQNVAAAFMVTNLFYGDSKI